MVTASPADARTRAVRTGREGMSLLELLVSMMVLLLALLFFTQSLVSSSTTGMATREVALATQAGRRMLETLQAAPFDQVFALYNDAPGDDPGGTGTAPGADIAGAGLSARPGDPDGMAGEILFPTLTGAPASLREDVIDPKLGTPRDLDGDGAVDALDHSGDYLILPVVVRFSWRGKAGDSRVEFKTLLGSM